MAKKSKYQINDFNSLLVNEPQLTYGRNVDEIIDDDKIMMEISRNGIYYNEFQDWVNDFPISSHDWSELLHMPYRTFNRHKAENRIFREEKADRILRLFSFISLGIQFFQDKDKFFEWLRMPSFALNDASPYGYLDSTFGIDYLTRYLGRLEHGIYA